jgi:hypothetical protein
LTIDREKSATKKIMPHGKSELHNAFMFSPIYMQENCISLHLDGKDRPK